LYGIKSIYIAEELLLNPFYDRALEPDIFCIQHGITSAGFVDGSHYVGREVFTNLQFMINGG
jgi:hypothetical protein